MTNLLIVVASNPLQILLAAVAIHHAIAPALRWVSEQQLTVARNTARVTA